MGLEVLSVIEDESLQQNARDVGAHALRELRALLPKHEAVGDVRGEGLMLGVEFVKDRSTRAPHPDLAKHVNAHMRANRVLVSVDGPHASVIKMKPPMVITKVCAPWSRPQHGVRVRERVSRVRERVWPYLCASGP